MERARQAAEEVERKREEEERIKREEEERLRAEEEKKRLECNCELVLRVPTSVKRSLHFLE